MTAQRAENVSDEQQVTVTEEMVAADPVGQIARLAALVGGVIVAIMGVVALLGMEWSNASATDPAISTAGMKFVPVTAGAAAVLGLFLIGAAAVRDGNARVAVGGISAALGAAILLFDGIQSDLRLADRHGWLFFIVGVVYIVSGLLSERTTVRRRRSTNRSAVAQR